VQRNTLLGYRFLLAALVVVATAAQFARSVLELGFDPWNFFGYFTILSNLLGAYALVWGAVRFIRRSKPSAAYEVVRGSATAALAIVGIVFGLLLSGIESDAVIPWVDTVHHVVMPIGIVLDWLLWAPDRRIAWRRSLPWLIYPLAFLAWTLVRGAVVGWYPYWFLDPADGGAAGGPGGVALYSVGIAVGFFAVSALLVAIGNLLVARREKHPTRRPL